MRHSAAALLAFCFAGAALAGPVEVYRTGPQFCPQDRAAGAPVLAEAAVVARAHALLPEGFCGPNRWVDGCDTVPEIEYGAWRIYIHQYRVVEGRHEWSGLTHTYVILDKVGNCLANIPGTELGGRN